jgi:hypothetical protein
MKKELTAIFIFALFVSGCDVKSDRHDATVPESRAIGTNTAPDASEPEIIGTTVPVIGVPMVPVKEEREAIPIIMRGAESIDTVTGLPHIRVVGLPTDARTVNAPGVASKRNPFRDKKICVAIGLEGAHPVPVGEAAGLFDTTVSPGVVCDFAFVNDWGVLVIGVGATAGYFTAKNSDEDYMLDLALALKAEYLLTLDDFYVSGGIRGGGAIVNYRTIFDSEALTGVSLYIAPEIGVGYIVAGSVGVSLGVDYDIPIFVTGNVHANISPFVRTVYVM